MADPLSTADTDLLQRAIAAAEDPPDQELGLPRPEAATAFREMLERGRALTPKQRAWAEGVATGRHVEAEPEYENLVSRGLVPRGREVEPPALLRREKLPLKPPTRRTT